MKETICSLADLKPGQNARILDLEGDDLLVQRLLEMGVLEGSEVEFLRRAPLGDPIEARIDQRFNLSLRKSDAARVRVALS